MWRRLKLDVNLNQNENEQCLFLYHTVGNRVSSGPFLGRYLSTLNWKSWEIIVGFQNDDKRFIP